MEHLWFGKMIGTAENTRFTKIRVETVGRCAVRPTRKTLILGAIFGSENRFPLVLINTLIVKICHVIAQNCAQADMARANSHFGSSARTS